jgi:transcriptional regulator with XRE-family HTH domain
MNPEEIRIKIDEKKQKELFNNLIKKFKGGFDEVSSYLGITKSSLSKYKRGVVRYVPKEVLIKIVDYLKVEFPKTIFSGTIKQIRSDYMKKAHPVLEKKYGKKWAKELTNRRDFKGIHLDDFPDYIFVYLEDNYRQELLISAYDLFGSLTKLANAIGVSAGRLSCWFRGEQKDYKADKIGLQFIPLSKLKLISKYLVEDSREEFSMAEIEKHVLMYRMQAGNPIKNPHFPIRESPELIRLLFHLLGDGYSGNKNENANYRNTCNELLEEFKDDLKIFGYVPVYEQENSVKFPRVLAEVIENFYKVNSRTFDSAISDKIFQISNRNLCFGIRAFVDDEATVYSHSIRLTSANFNLLEGIKEILNFLKINSNDIKFQFNSRARYKKIYYLDIRDIERYSKLVGFTHLKKKMLLKKYVKSLKSRRRKRLLKS